MDSEGLTLTLFCDIGKVIIESFVILLKMFIGFISLDLIMWRE